MMNNPQMMTHWHQAMMGDPQAMQQMHDMMASNPQHMQSIIILLPIMGQPITKNSDVLSIINNIEDLLDQTSSEYSDGNQDIAFSLATTAYLENYEYIEGTIASKNL